MAARTRRYGRRGRGGVRFLLLQRPFIKEAAGQKPAFRFIRQIVRRFAALEQIGMQIEGLIQRIHNFEKRRGIGDQLPAQSVHQRTVFIGLF